MTVFGEDDPTPSLEVGRAFLEADPNNFWWVPSGHIENLLEAAFERIDELQDQNRLLAQERDALQARLRAADETL